MSDIEFKAWGKTPRLRRNVTITEKIDGTNAAVVILPIAEVDHIRHEDGRITLFNEDARKLVVLVEQGEGAHAVFAQSRKRFIIPGDDNFGFAAWVQANAADLVDTLGPGYHYGEWWGHGIQRGYGLAKGDRRFSLFNVARYSEAVQDAHRLGVLDEVRTVPVLARGILSDRQVDEALTDLREFGSSAVEYDNPEGIIVYHEDSRQVFKVLLESDEISKTEAGIA